MDVFRGLELSTNTIRLDRYEKGPECKKPPVARRVPLLLLLVEDPVSNWGMLTVLQLKLAKDPVTLAINAKVVIQSHA